MLLAPQARIFTFLRHKTSKAVRFVLKKTQLHRRRNGRAPPVPSRRGHGGHGAPHFSAKIILKIFLFLLKHNFYTEHDSPGRGKHKSEQKSIVERLIFTRDEMEVSSTPSLQKTGVYVGELHLVSLHGKFQLTPSIFGHQMAPLSVQCHDVKNFHHNFFGSSEHRTPKQITPLES